MIDYTKAAVEIISNDVKKILKVYRFVTIVAKTLPFVYFVYAIVAGVAFPVINIAFCALAMFFIVREIIISKKIDEYIQLLPFANKEAKKIIEKNIHLLKKEKSQKLLTTKWIKTIDSTLDFVFIAYAIFATTTHITWVSVVLAVCVVLTWLLRMVILVATLYTNSRRNLLLTAVANDLPIEFVNNWLVGNFGKMTEKEEEKAKEKLDKIVDQRREEKAKKWQQRKEKLKGFFKNND